MAERVGEQFRLMLPVALFVVAVVAGLGFLALLANRSKAEYDAANQLVPGEDSGAPAEWAGSHSREAKLHRRLVDAMRALRANQLFDDDGGLLDLRVELEHQIQRIDERLIAVAALPASVRADPLTELATDVSMVEGVLADLVGKVGADARAGLVEAVATIEERLDLIGEARSSLDEQVLDLEPPERPEPPSAPEEALEPPEPEVGESGTS